MTTHPGSFGTRLSAAWRRRDVRLVGWVVLFGAAAVVLGIMRFDLVIQANTPTGGVG